MATANTRKRIGASATSPGVTAQASQDAVASPDETNTDTTAEVQAAPETVTVYVPQHFTLTTEAGPVVYRKGLQDMPADHATHWWSRVNGVEVKES